MKKYKKFLRSSKLKKNISTKVKRRRIHKKCKFIQYSIKDIAQIFSPHNTTQYLIENHSSPFYFDEDEEEDFDLNLSLNPLQSLDSGNTNTSTVLQEGFKATVSDYDIAPTAVQSQESQIFKFSFE